MNFKQWLLSEDRTQDAADFISQRKDINLSLLWSYFIKYPKANEFVQKAAPTAPNNMKQYYNLQYLKTIKGPHLDFIADTIAKQMKEQDIVDFIKYFIGKDSEEDKKIRSLAPTWVISRVLKYGDKQYQADYDKKDEVLPANTWLVHFTDNPVDIAKNGFTKGQKDYKNIGYTFANTDRSTGAGWNFAYIADKPIDKHSTPDYNLGLTGKYGKHAVLFQSKGVHTHHSVDQENQVIFNGPDVSPKDIFVLYFKGWDTFEVLGKDKPVFSGTFEECIEWVKKHANEIKSDTAFGTEYQGFKPKDYSQYSDEEKLKMAYQR